ncbi:hypothetical protein [Sphingomonas lenta]|nr:hypothetical protein [Sphingomonas lenta]
MEPLIDGSVVVPVVPDIVPEPVVVPVVPICCCIAGSLVVDCMVEPAVPVADGSVVPVVPVVAGSVVGDEVVVPVWPEGVVDCAAPESLEVVPVV